MLHIEDRTVREHGPALLAVARRAVSRREDAEDLVQETWISALRSAASFEARASPRTWLVSILRRRIADRFRQPRLQQLAFDEPNAPSSESAPEAWLDAHELAGLAIRALATLSERERRAVLLCDVQELDRAQARAALAVTRVHLRVLLFRARQKLEQALRPAGLERS